MNQLMNAQLNPGYSADGNGYSPTANELFNMLPYMAIPVLLVLIGGLYFINLYRKRELKH